MKKAVIVLIFPIIFANIVFSQNQNDAENLRSEIRGKIGSIRSEFRKVEDLIDKRKGILRGCLYRENINGIGFCYGDNFNDLLGHLKRAIENLNKMTVDQATSSNNVEEFWEKIERGFPLLLSSFLPGWIHRHTYTIGMGVNEAEYIGRWFHIGKFARDVIRVHVLNANNGEEGTNYKDFFDEGELLTGENSTKEYYKELFYSCYFWSGCKKKLADKLLKGDDVKTSLELYLNYLKNNKILNKMEELTENFEKVIQEYNGRIEGGVNLCLTTLKDVEDKIKNENNTTTLNNILQNLIQFSSVMASSTIGDYEGKTIPVLLETIYKQGFLRTFNKAMFTKDLEGGYKIGIQHIFPNQLDDEIKFWNDLYKESQELFNAFFAYCVGDTLITGKTPGGRTIENLGKNFEKEVQDFNKKFTFTWVTLEVKPEEISLAVIPPVVWSDEHRGAESLKEITPERIFDEIRNFLFSLAPIMFILLLVVGAIFYIVSPIKIEYIKTGSEYLKWAVIGYFLLLAISAIFSALKMIFGAP